MDYNKFKKFFYNNNFKNINMKLKVFQKYYIKCLIETNKISNFTEAALSFKKNFSEIDLLLKEDTIKKLFSKYKGSNKNLNIEEVIRSLKINNNNIIVDIFPIKSNYKNKDKKIEEREQNIIILSSKTMIKILDENNGKMYGLDFTFRNIPKSFAPY